MFESLFSLPFLGQIIDFATLVFAYLMRIASGAYIATNITKCQRPEQMLVLYDLEQDIDSREVRETLCTLDLDVLVKPCPRGGSRFTNERKKLAKNDTSLPLLYDPNSNKVISNAKAINAYLWNTYGKKATPNLGFRLALSDLVGPVSGHITSMLRPCDSHGRKAKASKIPKEPLFLWGNEGSPFVARVREALSSLEIAYIYKTTPKFTSTKRKEWIQRFGDQLSAGRKMVGLIQIPLLEDPNTGKNLLESCDIVKYLYAEYSA